MSRVFRYRMYFRRMLYIHFACTRNFFFPFRSCPFADPVSLSLSCYFFIFARWDSITLACRDAPATVSYSHPRAFFFPDTIGSTIARNLVVFGSVGSGNIVPKELRCVWMPCFSSLPRRIFTLGVNCSRCFQAILQLSLCSSNGFSFFSSAWEHTRGYFWMQVLYRAPASQMSPCSLLEIGKVALWVFCPLYFTRKKKCTV